MKKQLITTTEKVTVENYPYGFTLKTTLTDYIEFDKKKGYRHCTQTINPKNGRLNNPKKSTYYPLLVRYYNEAGHIKSMAFDFNGVDEINRGTKFLAENLDLFSNEEIIYFYNYIFSMAIVSMKAMAIYCGSKMDDLKPLFTNFFDNCKKGINSGENLFNLLVLDKEAIEATKQPDFNPFRVTTYTTEPTRTF